MDPMQKRLKRYVVAAAAVFGITHFLYQLMALSTVNLASNHQERQPQQRIQQVKENAFHPHAPQREAELQEDNSAIRSQTTGHTSNASRSPLTHRTLASLDKHADAHLNGHSGIAGTVIITQLHMRPANSSEMTPSGMDARLPATCPSVGLPTIPESTLTWQMVVAGHSYVFSAFVEKRLDRREIKVLGTADTRRRGKPNFCHIWYKNYSYPVVVNAVDEIVPETHNQR